MPHAPDAPLFSVIVPTYERGPLVRNALASVQAQSLDSWECIVVDDASGTPPEVPHDPRFRLIRRERNGGTGAARNTGIDAARGRFVTFLDDDDLYTPQRLALAADAHERAPIVVAFLALHDLPDDARFQKRRVLEGFAGNTILDEPIPSVGTTSIERSLVVRYDEDLRTSEDVEWWLRQAQAGPVTTVREVVYLRRRHESGHRSDMSPAHLESRLRILEQHADWMHAHPRAAAFHWKKAAGTAWVLGRNREARRYFANALRHRPSIKTAAHLVRTLSPRPART